MIEHLHAHFEHQTDLPFKKISTGSIFSFPDEGCAESSESQNTKFHYEIPIFPGKIRRHSVGHVPQIAECDVTICRKLVLA